MLLLGSLLIGLAQIAILPPWEGFDETAHYSYIQQIAETGHWPRLGEPMSRDIDDYLDAAPTAASMTPRWTYRDFFAAPADVIARGRALIQDAPASRAWQPGVRINWQAQHPPLYYALMAPAYLASKGWSLTHHLMLLRGLSYLLACAGLYIAAIAAWRASGSTAALAVGLWPAVFPMWFPEMARLGNDSLVILIAALTFPLAQRLAAGGGGTRDHALLGVMLGLGLLTKATFLPFVAATLLILALAPLTRRDTAHLKSPVIAGVVIALICGWWYVTKFAATGSVIGSNDATVMVRSGGMLAGLTAHGDVQTFLRLPWMLPASFLWSGTWSFVLPSRVTLLLLAATTALIALGCVYTMRGRKSDASERLALLTLVLFVTALLYQSLVLISTGIPSAPAWYLHSFAPVLAPLLAAGMVALARWRIAAVAVVLYPLAFLPLAMGINALYFAGCGATQANLRYFDFSSATCSLTQVRDHLTVFGAPDAALALFLAGWSLTAFGVVLALRYLFTQSHEAAYTSITSTR